jgi:hypothetical protein
MDRWEAKEKKLPTFDSLYPCPVCGSSKRYTVKMNCVECHLARIGSKSSPRNIAKAAKLVTYQTGKPCKKGHVAMRYTSTGQCVECVNPKSDLVSIRLRVHPQDIPKLEAYATALRMDRPPLTSNR